MHLNGLVIELYRLHELTGYSQSKWVSEMLVLSAVAKGLVFGNISRYVVGLPRVLCTQSVVWGGMGTLVFLVAE